MKKTKNESVKDTVLEENKNTAKNQPVRGKEKGDSEMLFKKVLYGYDPDEVASYINELNRTYESAARMHEAKLSSIKEELVLSNRERDSYSEKYKECQIKLNSIEKPDTKTGSEEYESIIAQLKARCEQLENENIRLQSAESSSSDSGYADRALLLEAEISKLEESNASLQRENTELLNKLQKSENISEEYKAVFAQLEAAKVHLDVKEKELAEKNVILEEKAAEINELLAQTENFKKQSAELEIKNSVLNQRVSENEDELIRLKDENKIQAFEHAEKINSLETEHAKDKLAMQKELKLYSYYVDRAELTLGELTKQMEQIKQSLNSVQEK